MNLSEKTVTAISVIKEQLQHIQDEAIPDAVNHRDYEVVAALICVVNQTNSALDVLQSLNKTSCAAYNAQYEG